MTITKRAFLLLGQKPWVVPRRKQRPPHPHLMQKAVSPEFFKFSFLLSSMQVGKSIGFVQIFDFRFSMDLHVLGFPEHDLTISRKYLSACLCLTVGV